MMKEEEVIKFNMYGHTNLWKMADAKNPQNHFGVEISNTWYWYDSWIENVRKYCKENESKFV